VIAHLIAGKRVESKTTFQTLNPATNEPIAEVASGGEEEIAAAVAAARRHSPGGRGWRRPNARS
jgi:5-carboxymethyl-2-hydroxymuconic-semialdehyde dehydrogenase